MNGGSRSSHSLLKDCGKLDTAFRRNGVGTEHQPVDRIVPAQTLADPAGGDASALRMGPGR